MRSIKGWLFAAIFTFSASATALAAVCEVDIQRAYDIAIKRGWNFKCVYGVLHFDGQKRPGCAIKPVVPGVNETASFFSNAAVPDPARKRYFRNGWRVEYFEVIGGQWADRLTPLTGVPARVSFSFKAKAGRWTRRYVSKLVLAKKSGVCADVYEEAF